MKKLPVIKKVEDIVNALVSGFTEWDTLGYVKTKTKGDLVLFHYTRDAIFGEDWNEFEKLSRGLIINKKTGEIVCRPFDKFFNWGEGGRKAPYTAHIVNVFEKLDGSMGALYRDNGGYFISNIRNFDTSQSLWATNYFREYYGDIVDKIPNNYTLIFEIICEDSKVIVPYSESLYGIFLLAIRDRFTGEELPFWPSHEIADSVYEFAKRFNFLIPHVYSVGNVELIIKACGDSSNIHQHYQEIYYSSIVEGYVVLFSNGERYKFKTDEWLEIHKSGLTTQLSPATTKVKLLSLIEKHGKDYVENLVNKIFTDEVGIVKSIYEEILGRYQDIIKEIAKMQIIFDVSIDRKSFVENVKRYSNLHSWALPPNFFHIVMCAFGRKDHTAHNVTFKQTIWKGLLLEAKDTLRRLEASTITDQENYR